MKNRHGDEYTFQKVSDDTYTITGDLKYWRYGGKEGQSEMDYNDLGFVDPSGGPFISVGYKIAGRKVVSIRMVSDTIFFDVES